MLVRAVGPGLVQFGVAGALTHPQLVVFQGGKIIGSNAAWGPTDDDAARLTAAFARAGAFRFADQTSSAATVVLTLAPGSYTLQVRSADGAPGNTLVEIYDVP